MILSTSIRIDIDSALRKHKVLLIHIHLIINYNFLRDLKSGEILTEGSFQKTKIQMSPEGEESLAGKEQFSWVAYLIYFK